MIGYRIIELKNGSPYSLFHGTQKTRKIPIGIWVEADKKIVRNGKQGKAPEYLSGWHFFRTYEDAKEAYDRFFSRKPNRFIIRANFSGNLRVKEHSRGKKCWLADRIFISKSFIDNLL